MPDTSKGGHALTKDATTAPEPFDRTKLNIHQRLLGLIEEIGNIQKQGQMVENDKFKYSFHAADDIMDALRPWTTKYGIISYCEADGEPHTEVHHFARSDGYRTRVPFLIYVINADNPQDYFRARWQGIGLDTQDKDYVKATTLGHKYWWLYTLKIGDGGSSDTDLTGHPENADREDLDAAEAAREARREKAARRQDAAKDEPQASLPKGLPAGFKADHWDELFAMGSSLPKGVFVPAPQFLDKKLIARIAHHSGGGADAQKGYEGMRAELVAHGAEVPAAGATTDAPEAAPATNPAYVDPDSIPDSIR